MKAIITKSLAYRAENESKNPGPTADEKAQCLQRFLEVFSDQMLQNDIGPHLSCSECEALASLLTVHGVDAESLLDGHAMGDEEGDDEEHLKRQAKIMEHDEKIEQQRKEAAQ